MLGKGQFSSENHPIGLNNTFERKKNSSNPESTCDIKKQFLLHVIYRRVWIITRQTKRWNMSLGLEEMPPGSARVLCRPRGQRASRLTMQHITPSSNSECTLGKSFFSSHGLDFFFWDYEYFKCVPKVSRGTVRFFWMINK